jgi:hypothetical protein
MDWNFLWGGLSAIAVVLGALYALYQILRKSYEDYLDVIKDGIKTDQEKIRLGEDFIEIMEKAHNAWSFLCKLITMFKARK